MPSRTTFPWRQMRYLAFVVVALLGLVGCSSAAIAPAVTSPKPTPAASSMVSSSAIRTVVLSGDSVGSVRFGESQQKVVGALKKLIGATEGGVQNAKGNCAIDAALYWTNFSVYFLGGRFVGYQTGNNLTDKGEPTFNGKTPQGLPRRRLVGRSAHALPRERDNACRERRRVRNQDHRGDDPWLPVARDLESAEQDQDRLHLGGVCRLPRCFARLKATTKPVPSGVGLQNQVICGRARGRSS